MSSTGGKRVLRCSRKKDDRISDLPDDILIFILSLLRVEEAARTSLLSRRWRYLWAFTRCLDFERPELRLLANDGTLQLEKLEFERCRFVEWVNQVLKSHKAPVLDVLRIAFDMGEERYKPVRYKSDRYKSDIDSWLKFAFVKKVQTLELNFYDTCGDITVPYYALTTQFLQNYKLGSLIKLYLNVVDLTGEVIGYLLSKCPFLEALAVQRAESLVNLKVNGPLPRLKHLAILGCWNLKSLEIFSLNLVSFKFRGNWTTTVSVKDVPSLVRVACAGCYPTFLFNDAPQLSCILSQLHTLYISFRKERLNRLPKFPTMRNLTHLELVLNARGASSLLCLMSLLKACPVLHELSLNFLSINELVKRRKKATKPSREGIEGRHECLKLFKLGGFVGCKIDKELILNVVNYAVSLEILFIEERSVNEPRLPRDDTIRARARQLITRLPPGVKLVVL